jgi:hypothetical protein
MFDPVGNLVQRQFQNGETGNNPIPHDSALYDALGSLVFDILESNGQNVPPIDQFGAFCQYGSLTDEQTKSGTGSGFPLLHGRYYNPTTGRYMSRSDRLGNSYEWYNDQSQWILLGFRGASFNPGIGAPFALVEAIDEGQSGDVEGAATDLITAGADVFGLGELAAAEKGLAEAGGAALKESTAEASEARFGAATSNNFRATFFASKPELKGQVIVHHAVEQQVLERFPGVVSKAEIRSIENLRGIPRERNSQLHLSTIRNEWNRFYISFNSGLEPTKAQLLKKAAEIDAKYGSFFYPTR